MDEDIAVCENEVQQARENTPNDDEQDNAYVRCLSKRRVNPPEIPRADDEFCLVEAGVPDPGVQARESKSRAWAACLVGHISRLDDGVSPAADISQAVVGLCADEWRGYMGALWSPPSVKRKMANGVEKYAANEGVRAVLTVRREKAKK